METKEIKESKGITLMVLVITIIVILILAGVTISAITGDNGIRGNAGQAKEETEIANEKEIVEKATIQAMGNNKYGNVEDDELQEQLDKEAGADKTEANDIGNQIEVVFIESNRYYLVEKDGNVKGEYLITEDKYPGNIIVGKDGEELNGKSETEEGGKPYEIWCIEDLVEWSQNYESYQNAYIKLGRTLNFESRLSYANGKVLNCNSIDELRDLLTKVSGNGFTPIKNFSGTFDGQSNEIQNIYINKTGKAGLFESIDGEVIIQNIGISGNITGTEDVGSICGTVEIYANATIKGCYNQANITNEGIDDWASAGGICGASHLGKITIINCYNAEQSQINGNMAGGILGITKTASDVFAIYNSFNLGEVKGEKYAGGMIAYSSNTGKCINVYTTGDIKGAEIIGGIIGGAMWDNPNGRQYDNCYFLKSSTVQQGAGRNVTVNATKLEELTNETIDELNIYITNNSTLTSDWKKWAIENRKPQFIEEMQTNT